jgi:D-glycero-alpha-D-manno-heptose-7-phosphate kinase
MIITRTPFRVSFLGGGTDIPWFFEEHGGATLAMSIDRYMYISAHPMFDSAETLLKYSQIELVQEIANLRHPIARAVLSNENISGIDISVSADIPSGTGLGSSSAFTVGLINLARLTKGIYTSKAELAAMACDLEIKQLGEPIGKQDQYASAFGGINLYKFHPSGEVAVTPIQIDRDSRNEFLSSFFLVRTKSKTRSASEVLKKQSEQARTSSEITESLLEMKELTLHISEAGALSVDSLAAAVNKSWALKKLSSPNASTPDIDQLVEHGLSSGASAAKLLGAGMAGFVLFVVKEANRKRFNDAFVGSHVLNVRPEFEGSSVIYSL